MSGLAHPEWLAPLAALLAAAAAGLAAAAWRARQRARRLLGGDAPAPGLAGDLLVLAALAAIALALLGPRIGERSVSLIQSGVDVVILMDVSRSMDARDAPPSRIDRARRTAEHILAELAPGDRAALAAFSGIGVLLTPLTPDTSALAEMLPALDTGLMQPHGSHLGEGVRAAVEAFDPESERPRVLVVLSDGESPEGSRDLGTLAAGRARARVVAAAFGSALGTTIPDHGVPYRDAAGRVVVTRRDPERLRRLAAGTRGAFFASDEWGAIDLAGAVAEIRLEAGGAPGEPTERRVPAERVAPFAALAFALLLVELVPRTRLRRLGRARRGAALAALSAGLLGADPAEPSLDVLAIEGHARAHPNDPGVLLDLGYARARDGALEGAARAFHAAAVYARDPARTALAYYDLGVVALAGGDLETARDAFFDALALAPDDTETRYNLEWTLREIARTAAPPPPPAPGEGQTDEPGEGSGAGGRGGSDPADDARGAGTPAGAARGDEWSAPELDAEEAERWLEKLRDDPARALRDAARRAARRARAPDRSAPTW